MNMESQFSAASKDDFWRLQEEIKELLVTQNQHAERIMRIERRRDEDSRVKSVWGSASPYVGAQEPIFNPTAEAFRNFEVDTPGLNSNLEHEEDRRRGASRANSVRFDESANNHYGSSSRQSMDLLPLRTGSGLGSHPLTERSLSHRSDGKGSISSSMRANSFGLESRLGMTNSPKLAANPPPAFYVLGPLPAIIRCWLTDTFSNDSLLYAAICTGSYGSSVTSALLRRCGLDDEIFEENGTCKVRLPIYLTEATIQAASSRPTSPIPQVPTLMAKFSVIDSPADDRAIHIIVGSDILRAHNADILFSQDKLMIFDTDRNHLAIPLVRPESEASFKGLFTACTQIQPTRTPAAGVIARPAKTFSNTTASTASELDEPTPDSVIEPEKDRSFDPPPASTPSSAKSGAWGGSWRAAAANADPNSTATYIRPPVPRSMKVLRSGRSMASSSRGAAAGENARPSVATEEKEKPKPAGEAAQSSGKTSAKSNPVGQGSAFGWLNS